MEGLLPHLIYICEVTSMYWQLSGTNDTVKGVRKHKNLRSHGAYLKQLFFIELKGRKIQILLLEWSEACIYQNMYSS